MIVSENSVLIEGYKGGFSFKKIPQPLFNPKAVAFCGDDWLKHWGNVGPVSVLPEDLATILEQPSPFQENNKIGESQILTWVPTHVNGHNLTLDKLQKFLEHPTGHNTSIINFEYYSEAVQQALGGIPVDRGHWILMEKDPIPGSVNATYQKQQECIDNMGGGAYRSPTTMEAILGMATCYLKTGERPYGVSLGVSRVPWLVTRCQETVTVDGHQERVYVGAFSSEGLYIGSSRELQENHWCGIAAVQSF